MADPQPPSESERRTFVAKLAEFRNTLRVAEQEMLDALVGAAVMKRTPHELERYWIGPRRDSSADTELTAN